MWHLPAICTVCSQVCDSLSAFQFCHGSSNGRAAGRESNGKKGSKPGPGTSGKSGSSKACFASPSPASDCSTPYQWCMPEATVSSLCGATSQSSNSRSMVHKDGKSVCCQVVVALSSCMHCSHLCVTSKHGVRQHVLAVATPIV